MMLMELEHKEAYSRERMEALTSEISRMQIQMNKLNTQSYVKDESILGLQQQLNNLLKQASSPNYSTSKSHITERNYEEDSEEISKSSLEKSKVNDYNKKRSTEEQYKDRTQKSYKEPKESKVDKEGNKTERKVGESIYQVQQKLEDKEKIVKNIENKLLSLQIEKKTVIYYV